MRSRVSRLLRVVGAGAVCTVSLAGCSGGLTAEASHVADSVSRLLSADPSLLTPAVADTYELHGEVSSAVRRDESPLASVASAVTCHLEIEDGVLVAGVITATLGGVSDLKFELTDPVVFELAGEPKDQIVGTGTLTVDASVYPETRVLFEPSATNGGVTLIATIPVPDSIVSSSGLDAEPLQFALQGQHANW